MQLARRRRTNPRWKALQIQRKRINVSTRLLVTPAGDGKERLTCRKCGWTYVQNMGGMTDEMLANTSKTMVERLIRYRGNGGIWAVCDGCTKQERDQRYPLDGVPRYLS